MRAKSEWQAPEVMVFAEELNFHLLPQVGAAWMPQGPPDGIMPPGKTAQPSLAGALHGATGRLRHCRGPRTNKALLRDLRTLLEQTDAESSGTRLSVVAAP